MDYQLGIPVTLRETFIVDGVHTDPTTVVIHVLWPDGTEHTYTAPDVTNPSVGVYELVTNPAFYTQLDTYMYWGVGTGAVEATSEPRSFRIVDVLDDRQWGPCEDWATVDEVNEYCEASQSSEDFTEATAVANSVLFALVPRYSGTCGPVRVRPCGEPCRIPWTSGWSWGGDGWLALGDALDAVRAGCGCSPLSRVKLSGRVRTIHEVTIDGDVISPSAYRLDENMWLTRIDGERWPSCQDMTLAETEEGTFSVVYTFGVDPPPDARLAAKELACAVFQTIALANGSISDECPLPNNVTRVERQGITFDLKAFTGWAFSKDKGWATGLPLVDMFLNARNPQGRRKRRSTAWSPDMEQSAKKLGP